MSLRILRIFLVLVTLGALYAAYDQYETGEAIRSEVAAELPRLSALQMEMGQLSKLPTKVLRPADEALEDLAGRLIDDTDLLGSTVAIEPPKEGIKWTPVKYGVTKTVVGFRSEAERSAALAYFSLVWQLLDRQPVKVTDAFISGEQDTVKFNVKVELLALQEGK